MRHCPVRMRRGGVLPCVDGGEDQHGRVIKGHPRRRLRINTTMQVTIICVEESACPFAKTTSSAIYCSRLVLILKTTLSLTFSSRMTTGAWRQYRRSAHSARQEGSKHTSCRSEGSQCENASIYLKWDASQATRVTITHCLTSHRVCSALPPQAHGRRRARHERISFRKAVMSLNLFAALRWFWLCYERVPTLVRPRSKANLCALVYLISIDLQAW